MSTLSKPPEPISNDQALENFFAWLEATGIEPYDHQEEAIIELFAGKNVILNTPTGSGKSLVALAVHYRGLCTGRRTYYTVPIKALANEKFLSLCKTFGPENVGLVTGDATVNGDAPIICCTAEIVSNLALREGSQAPVHDLIVDEFHYYSDRDRGISWQIPLLTLAQTRFCLMSATIGETSRFERELTEMTGAETVLVQSDQRPVPLEFNYSETPLEDQIAELVEKDRAPVYLVHFTQNSTAQTATNLVSRNFLTKEERAQLTEALINVKFSSPYGKDLKRLLTNGIGVHHAGLLPKYRILVEQLAQQGLLKVICGTDTLGVGVNVPIRTVVFTQLCKYNGEKTAILTVRDFKQICGRAGRRGFDDIGYVIAQAPAHEIENKVAQAKAAEKAAKGKKVKSSPKKSPPEHGYVHWNEETYRKLIDSPPEPLVSSFKLRQSMLLNILSRENSDGCAALKHLIEVCHESDHNKKKVRKHSFQLFRGLVESTILSIVPPAERSAPYEKLKLNIDLPEDFSLNQALGLWLLDVLPKLDKEAPEYSLNLISCIEAILEDPQIVLRAQTKHQRDLIFQNLKDEGLSYEERMTKLEEVDYPKPGKDFIYDTYNDFISKNPWLKDNSIRPKSIVREMFEEYYNFPDYIRTYKLERTEGVLLRHLSEVYKVLTQTIPITAKTPEVIEAEEYISEILEATDSSLVDEWQKLQDPDYDPEQAREEKLASQKDVPLSRRKAEFSAQLHRTVMSFLKHFRDEHWGDCFDLIQPTAGNGVTWEKHHFEDTIDDYLDDVDLYLMDPEARNRKHHHLQEETSEDGTRLLRVTQTLCDPDLELLWSAHFLVNLDATDSTGELHLTFNGFSRAE